MPKTKNQGKNKDRFEVRGGLLNEFELAQNEGAMAQEERQRFEQRQELRAEGEGAPASPQEAEAARIREVIQTAHEKAQRNLEKRKRIGATGARTKSGARRGAQKRAAKGSGSRKAAAKKATGKKAAGKKAAGAKGRAASAAKKGSARHSGSKKAAAQSGVGKKGTGGARSAGRGGAKKGAARKAAVKKSPGRRTR